MNKRPANELSEAHSKLLIAAEKCCENAYAPYSKFRVGAALLAKSGKVYLGVNVENCSFGLTICAERMALGAAITAGEREFDAIAIATDTGAMPCGACRQMLAEFGNMQVLACRSSDGRVLATQLDQILPYSFRLTDDVAGSETC